MAWATSSSLSTGDLITASEWNQAVVSNTNALRAGGIAIASQAANDVLYASSATQVARLGAGTAGKVLTTQGTGSAPTWETPTAFDADAAQVFNESGADVDFRIESDDNTSMLFVDGGEDRVGIGTSSPDSLLDLFLDDASVLGTVIIEQDGTGDASTRYLLTGLISWSTGVDNSDGDSYKISQSSNLNDSVRLSIDTSGAVHVPGAFSKGSGSFKIDHPLPSMSDHFLVHSFVESCGAELIYRGQATLIAGAIQVDLDEAAGMTSGTFVRLCREAQAWITMESGGWHHVRGSVDGSTLTIECEEACEDQVAWLVIANRHDAHMRDPGTLWCDDQGYPIIEPLKPEPEPEPEPE